MMLTGQAVS